MKKDDRMLLAFYPPLARPMLTRATLRQVLI